MNDSVAALNIGFHNVGRIHGHASIACRNIQSLTVDRLCTSQAYDGRSWHSPGYDVIGQNADQPIFVFRFEQRFHGARVRENTDLVTALSYANVEKDFLNTSIDEDGVIVSGGIRSKPTDMIELGANVNYVDIGNKDDVGFGVTGRVFVLPVASIGLSYDKLDNSDKFTVDVRYDF